MVYRGCASRFGRQTQGASRLLVISIPGIVVATRCGYAMTPGFGNYLCRGSHLVQNISLTSSALTALPSHGRPILSGGRQRCRQKLPQLFRNWMIGVGVMADG